jgi:hypothetical protein
MVEYNLDVGDAEFEEQKSKNSGRVKKLSRKGNNQYLTIKTDNNRTFSGLDYSMSKSFESSNKKSKTNSVYDYVGETVKSPDDVGEVVEVVKNKNNKLYAKIKWNKPVSTYKSGEKNYFTKTPVANITKYLNENK